MIADDYKMLMNDDLEDIHCDRLQVSKVSRQINLELPIIIIRRLSLSSLKKRNWYGKWYCQLSMSTSTTNMTNGYLIRKDPIVLADVCLVMLIFWRQWKERNFLRHLMENI